MYETYYGFAEKPFSLTPDPKYLYRSRSHGAAFDLLQYAVGRREGFVVITGDIGTGKTTLCRALLEQIDRTTFTALILNPFLTEEDLLRRILHDFSVVSEEHIKSGGSLAAATKQQLIDRLYDFLLGLVPLKASAVLMIDEAQNLPMPVLEQIRILSNLETDKEKLLQIILVGQLHLAKLLRTPELRQLDQRVSIRYELEPLDREGVAAYVFHRLTVARGSAGVTFSASALKEVHRASRGIPRLINLICDRALLAGFSARTDRITPDLVTHAARSLNLAASPVGRRIPWLHTRTVRNAGSAVALFSTALTVATATHFYETRSAEKRQLIPEIASSVSQPRDAPREITPGKSRQASVSRETPGARLIQAAASPDNDERRLPADAAVTILAASFPLPPSEGSRDAIRSLTSRLEATGFRVFYAEADLGPRGRWQRILAGAYADRTRARRDIDRLKAAVPSIDPLIVGAAFATAMNGVLSKPVDPVVRSSSTEP
ncbi:MAG TPA: AAA family ATPase [Vicinamibacterales bacterium]|nr:AAA family ATPase [Vicinamibacterales bacterium]